MAKYVLSKRSMNSLAGVNPKLREVVIRAIQLTEQDFVVTQGLRTREDMKVNYGMGRTVAQLAVHGIEAKYAKPKERKVTFLNNPFASNHRNGNAVDIYPYPVDYDTPSKYAKINEAIQKASKELGVTVTWGGTWKAKDLPHYEVK